MKQSPVILISTIIVAIVVTSVVYFNIQQNRHQQADKNKSLNDSIGAATNTPANGSQNNTLQAKITSPEEIGSLSYSDEGDGQIYQNSYLNLKMVVPKNWVLGDIYDKNLIIFKDPVDAELNFYATQKQNPEYFQFSNIKVEDWIQNSQTLQIKYYQDFQSWLNNGEGFVRSGCSTLKECLSKQENIKVESFSINNNTAMSVTSSEGDAENNTVFIEHNGIYEFDYLGTNVVPYNLKKVIETLSFLK